MKKNLILTISVIAMAAAMSSCSKENNEQEVSEYITIDAGVNSLTRATSTAFEPNDAVSIYAWTGSNTAVQTPLVVDNVLNVYDGTKWTASLPMLWEDQITPHYFLGIFPQKSVTDFTADHYNEVPDVLVATVLGDGRKATNGIVPLVFDHVMAKLTVNLTFRSEFNSPIPSVESMTVNAKTGASVNYLTKVVTVDDGEPRKVPMTATTPNEVFSQVVPPQTIYIIEIKIDGKTYVYNNEGGFPLVQGKVQTINMIVGRDKIELGSVTINDWGIGDEITDGEAKNN